MKRYRYLIVFLLVFLWSLAICLVADARKQGYTLKVDKIAESELEEEQMSRGSFMVASYCTDCNNGYRLDQISFAGFDKPQNSNYETFFITNHTDRTMSGVNLYVEYMMPDGRQLHKRFLRLTCNIPPGETRSLQLDSWDKQKSFYYQLSTPAAKKQGTPFIVVFDPVAYYLRY